MDEDVQVELDARYRETMIEKIFTFKLHQFAVEERLGHRLAQILLQSYFIILFVSFVNPKEVFGFNTFLEKFATAATVPMFLFFLTFFGSLIGAIFMTDLKSNYPCAMLKVFCYVKLALIYLVFPLANPIYMRAIIDSLDPEVISPHSNTVIVMGYIFIISFAILAVFCLATMRNNYPTRGVMNVPSEISETLLYILNAVIQVHQTMRDRPWMREISTVLDVFQYILSVGVLALAFRYSVFWNYRLNRLYITYTCQLLFLRVYCNNVIARFQDTRLQSWLLFAFPLLGFVGKLTQNLIFHLWSFRVAMNHRGVDYDRYMTVFTYDLLKEQERLDQLDYLERELLIMLEHSVKRNYRGRLISKRAETINIEPALLYLQDMTIDKLTRVHNLYTLMKLKLLFVKQSLSTLNMTLNMLRKKLGKKANFSFEFFHIRALMQVRMEQLYTGSIDATQYERTTLGQIYESMSKGDGDKFKFGNSNIDLNRVFVIKDMYEKVIEKINRYLAIKSDLFARLYDNQQFGISYIYKIHERLHNLGAKIEKAFMAFANAKDTPPYVLAAASAYNLKVRFQVRQADIFFKRYRVLLSKLQVHNRLQKGMDKDNISYDSVIFKVEISKNRLGEILDITPGYKEHLGERDHGVIGLNMNFLFPGSMAEDHAQMMSNFDNLKTFNVQSDGMINGFDGFLRSVSFYVKIYGSLNGEMSSIAWVRVKDGGTSSVVLADERLNLLSADESFWQVLKVMGYSAPITNLNQLSPSLCSNIELLKFIITQQDSHDLENEKSFLRWKEDVKEIYRQYSSLGIIHKVQPPPEVATLNERAKNSQLAATTETVEFHKKKYFKLMITFDVTSNDRNIRNLKSTLAHKIAFLARLRSSEQNTSSNVQISSSNIVNSGTNDNDSMEIATINSNMNIGYVAEVSLVEQAPFDQIIESISKLDNMALLLAPAVTKGFPQEIAEYIASMHRGEHNNILLQQSFSDSAVTPRNYDYLMPKGPKDPLFGPNEDNSMHRLGGMQQTASQTDFFSRSRPESSIVINIPEKRGVPQIGFKDSGPLPREFTSPDLLKFFQRVDMEGAPTTRRNPINTEAGENLITNRSMQKDKDNLGVTNSPENLKSRKKGQLASILEGKISRFTGGLVKTLKTATLGSKHFSQGISAGKDQIKITAKEDDVMFSSYPPNIDKLMRSILTFSNRITKKHNEVEGGLESMASRSTTTTNSKNTTIFRRVNNAIQSHKKVQTVYILIFGLIFISCIYIGLFQYLNSLLIEYNESNVYCMVFLTYFIGIDRAIVTGALSIDSDMEFIEVVYDEPEYLRISEIINDCIGVTEPLPFLLKNIEESMKWIEFYMQETEDRLAKLDSKQDEVTIVGLMSHKRDYRLLNRHADGDFEVEEMSTHSLSWWKMLSSILFNFKYVVEFSKRVYSEAFDDRTITLDDIQQFSYLQKFKLEIDRLIYEDNLGFMRGIMEEAMDYMITKDHEHHFYLINAMLIVGGVLIAVMLIYLYYMSMKNSRRMFDLVDSYNLLKAWELHAIIEDITEEQLTYSRYMYNESKLVAKYVEFNSMNYMLNNSRVINLQEKYARDKIRIKFKRDYVPKSVKASICATFLNIVIYVVVVMMVQLFSSLNDKRMVMENAIMKLHSSLIEVECNFLNTIIYVNYGDYLKINGKLPSSDYYESSISTAIGLMMDLRADIQDYFGDKETEVLLRLLFDEICGFFSADTQTSGSDMNDYTFCKGLNPALTLKGLVGFLQAEKQFLDDIRMQLERDHMDMIIESRLRHVEGVREIFYTQEFLRYRTAHRLFIDLFYTNAIPTTMARVEEIRDELNYNMGEVVYAAVIGVYVILAVVYIFTFYYQVQDLTYFYEIFSLIDPLFIVNNKYLFNKMRDSYSGYI